MRQPFSIRKSIRHPGLPEPWCRCWLRRRKAITLSDQSLTIIVDIDGTLVDSNYHHAIAWSRALRRFDLIAPLWRIHRHIGMGGDKIVAAVAGDRVEEEHGDRGARGGRGDLRRADR